MTVCRWVLITGNMCINVTDREEHLSNAHLREIWLDFKFSELTAGFQHVVGFETVIH